MNTRTIDYLFKMEISDMEKLLSFDFPQDGHEPDEAGIKGKSKNGPLDNAGFEDEMSITLTKDGSVIKFKVTDLIAMAQYGYKEWKQR